MSGIPAGAIVHVGGKTVLNRLQSVGLQDPKVPTQIAYETGNNLAVGKILTEADFRFQMTSWDVSTDLLALLSGEVAAALGDQISAADAVGKVYKWENVGSFNLTSPWKSNTGSQGGNVAAGVIIPNLYPTALSYRLGVTENAEMQVTLASGSYFMAEAMPLEEFATGDGATVAFATAHNAKVYRIGGAGSTNYQHIFGVMVNGVQQIPGIDYTESGGDVLNPIVATLSAALATGAPITQLPVAALADPIASGVSLTMTDGVNTQTWVTSGVAAAAATDIPVVSQTPNFAYPDAQSITGPEIITSTVVTITFAQAPANAAVVRYCYFSETAAAIPQADNLPASATLPSAVRGRDITILVGDPNGVGAEAPLKLYGVQTVELQATVSGALQRQMGTQDPIGFAETAIDTTGTITIEPASIDKLFQFLASSMGIDEREVFGYINQYEFPLTFVIHEPGSQNIIKSIFVPDAFFQAPGENARVQQVTRYSVSFESMTGTFHEVKGALPTIGE
jgi:hypothetical protein